MRSGRFERASRTLPSRVTGETVIGIHRIRDWQIANPTDRNHFDPFPRGVAPQSDCRRLTGHRERFDGPGRAWSAGFRGRGEDEPRGIEVVAAPELRAIPVGASVESGRVAGARRRSVSGPTSDKPIARTKPTLTISAIAPI